MEIIEGGPIKFSAADVEECKLVGQPVMCWGKVLVVDDKPLGVVDTYMGFDADGEVLVRASFTPTEKVIGQAGAA